MDRWSSTSASNTNNHLYLHKQFRNEGNPGPGAEIQPRSVPRIDSARPSIPVITGSNRKVVVAPCSPMLRATYGKTGPLEFAQHLKTRYPTIICFSRMITYVFPSLTTLLEKNLEVRCLTSNNYSNIFFIFFTGYRKTRYVIQGTERQDPEPN
jgi:hypothetical protein